METGTVDPTAKSDGCVSRILAAVESHDAAGYREALDYTTRLYTVRPLVAERDALLLMERLVAEPDLAGDDKALRRALKTLNRRRAKFARRANALAAHMPA